MPFPTFARCAFAPSWTGWRCFYAQGDCPLEWRGLTGYGRSELGAWADLLLRIAALRPRRR